MIPPKENLISLLSPAANIGNVSSVGLTILSLFVSLRVDGARKDPGPVCTVKCFVGPLLILTKGRGDLLIVLLLSPKKNNPSVPRLTL